ncbi:GRP family sugar transporter [Siphonobacter sp. SORGH_AS_0500]|uniref:GRP family sugar transporter n=1 Tax=Siphonobacter sp. SORGH_AS_0500 TaxID=1864824 RepID=UPI00285EE5CC|nr:GRP family sugar transporter [Siphonobacter sp. SORGH_AS_0500]MDR6194851.1 glucose uptake protein [Siphonobacter sp. SORGH_AS_0500]
MVIIENATLAIIFCLITMLCWGSWTSGQKLVTQSAPLSIFYRDYVYGIVITALVLAFTLGSLGSNERAFLDDIQQATLRNMALAVIGGMIFNIGNMLLTVGINISGIAVAMPVGTGLSLALGLIVNYIAKPEGNVGLLAIGGGLVLASIAACAFAYKAKNEEEEEDEGSSTKGIWVALAGGVFSGFFFLLVTQSIVEDIALPEAEKLTPYTGFVLFALGILISNPLIEWTVKRLKLLEGEDEVRYGDVSAKEHGLSLGSGFIWGIGMITLLLGSQDAGGAVSYGLSQGATVVSVLWGLLVWKEFEGAPAKAKRYLWIMGGTYVVGLILIVMARASAG